MLTTEQLRPILEKKYNRDDWYKILRENFNANKLLETPASITIKDNEFGAKAYELGVLNTTDGYKVGIYEVDTPGVKQIYRNKIGLRNLLKNVYQTDVDAALIVFTQDEKWRFSYVSEVTVRNPQTGERESVKTDAKRYTYLLGKGEKAKTAAERFAKVQQGNATLNSGTTLDALKETFSVEKMSKDFFNEYRKHYGEFLIHLIGKNEDDKAIALASPLFKTVFNGDEKKARDFVKKMLGRIVFLYFLEKKGWLGVPEKEHWGKGDPDFLRNLFDDCIDQDSFYPLVLEPLFHRTLNEERIDDLFAVDPSVFHSAKYDRLKIPFLNGGLFEPERYNTDYIVFPARLFKSLFNFFDRYNFTVHEDSPEEHTVAVDPEMLGHIFENLLEDNKDKGAFYTPKEIVHYMCQESLIEYLCNKCKPSNGSEKSLMEMRNVIGRFIQNQEISGIAEADYEESILIALRDVKICDPAIGSGAFPMGILLEIFHAIETLYYAAKDTTERIWVLQNGWNPAEVKLSIIENSIYGVDIEPGAVDIARLRFWLSLVVDESIPQPLPNLDYKIMQGNSLLENFEGIDLRVHLEDETSLFRDPNKFTIEDVLELKAQVRKYFNADSPAKKSALQQTINQVISKFIAERIADRQKRNIEALRIANENLILRARSIPTTEKLKSKQQDSLKKLRLIVEKLTDEERHLSELKHELDLIQRTKIYPYFLWHLWFSEIFEKGGFDIVIGNPPYIQLQKDGGKLANVYEPCGFETFEKTGDIYSLFYEKGYDILKPHGHLIYITSNKWMRAAYGATTRSFFAQNTNPKLLIDFAGQKIFESATVDTNILLFSKEENAQETRACIVKEKVLNKLSVFVSQNSSICQFALDGSWVISTPIEQKIKTKVETLGTPLKDWNISIYRGVLTGYNEAFIIDEKKRHELISEDPKSAEIIRPILRGRDIKRYSYTFADLWLINVHNGIKEKSIKPIDINDYPAVKKHLDHYYEELKIRADRGITPYNLRNCAYMEDFSKQKIVWIELTDHPNFCLDEQSFFTNNTVFFLNGDRLNYLLSFLNSRLCEWYFTKVAATSGAGTRRWIKIYIEQICIPKSPPIETENALSELAHQIQKLKAVCVDTTELENKVDTQIFKLFNITEEEIAYINESLSESDVKKAISSAES
jgi:hypothetical protein